MNTHLLKKEIDSKIFKWTAGRIASLGSFVVAMVAAILFAIGGMSFESNANKFAAAEHISMNASTVSHTYQKTRASFEPRKLEEQIPTTYERNEPVADVGISKNSEVILTDEQAKVVLAFNNYLKSRGQWAVVTSGKRTSENQLNIIKDKVADLGATQKFPQLEEASVMDTKIWLKAWQWLRAKHVPVNAPAAVPGASVSMHLKGQAIDFIAQDLDDLRSWFASYAKSSFAKQADLKITAIVREPGCVHVNLG